MQVVVYHLGFSLNIDFVFSPSILTNQIPTYNVRYYLLFQVSFLLDPILWMNGPKRTASNHLSRINNRYIKSSSLFFNRMIPSLSAHSGFFTTSTTCFMPSFLGLQPSFKVCQLAKLDQFWRAILDVKVPDGRNSGPNDVEVLLVAFMALPPRSSLKLRSFEFLAASNRMTVQ